MTTLDEMTTYSKREVVATLINESELVRAAGLPFNHVYDADAVRDPDDTEFPFLVVRWADVAEKLNHVDVQPFDIWVYDKGSDRTQAERIAKAAGDLLAAVVQVRKVGGWLMQISDEGQGADLTDENYDAVVVPRRLVAVASGL